MGPGKEPLAYRLVYSAPVEGFYEPLMDLIENGEFSRVLDVGAGYGIAAELMLDHVEELFLIEIEEAMAEKARERLISPKISVIVGDAASLPFRESSFDLVYFFDSLHHIRDRISALREGIRVLEDGGVLAVFDFDGSKLTTRLLSLAERIFGIPSSFFSLAEMRKLMEELGLRVERLEEGRMGSYSLVARK